MGLGQGGGGRGGATQDVTSLRVGDFVGANSHRPSVRLSVVAPLAAIFPPSAFGEPMEVLRWSR